MLISSPSVFCIFLPDSNIVKKSLLISHHLIVLNIFSLSFPSGPSLVCPFPPPHVIAHPPALCFSSSRDTTVKVWHVPTATEQRNLGGHTGGVTALCAPPPEYCRKMGILLLHVISVLSHCFYQTIQQTVKAFMHEALTCEGSLTHLVPHDSKQSEPLD